MNDVPRDLAGVDKSPSVSPQPQHDPNSLNQTRRNISTNPTSLSQTPKDRRKEESTHANSRSSSNGNDKMHQTQSVVDAVQEVEKQDVTQEQSNHFTRSRFSRSSTCTKSKIEERSKPKLSLSSDDHTNFDKPDISINACATILAEMDSMSYHRSLIRDANRVTERILQPMTLPWTHKVVPVARNIPCDIDEMMDVVTADDGSHRPFENGNFGFGQFETGRPSSGDSIIRFANSSDNFRASSRRSIDPGIIDFSTLVLPSIPMVRPPLFSDSGEHHNNDRKMRGSSLLGCFEEMQRHKRQRVEKARSFVTPYEISVKINSTSSRSSIFEPASKKTKIINNAMPITLNATLPFEVENGRRVNKTRAKIATKEFGSYDIQHGHNQVQSKKNLNRVLVGRTRLMWTRKQSSENPQRVSFSSLVTGQKLDAGAEKRPRNIRVRIKVDGEVCRDGKTKDNEKRSAEMNLQASLQCGELVRNLLDGRSDKVNLSYTVPPSIKCIPDSTGSVHVVCTSPGNILPSSVNSILKIAQNKSNRCCTVCWRSTEGGSEVHECVKCGLLAHIDCCLDPGEFKLLSTDEVHSKKTQWTCSICCHYDKNRFEICGKKNKSEKTTAVKKSKRKPRPTSKLKDTHFKSLKPQETNRSTATNKNDIRCAICLLPGGVMSRISLESEKLWAHETCRIWTSDETSSPNYASETCVLCGRNGVRSLTSRLKKENLFQYAPQRCVVKCAAAGCHIFVHPMCALVSTLESESMDKPTQKLSESVILDNIQKAKKKDLELCSQYTFTFTSVCRSTESRAGASGATSLPVIFCGIHNPARQKSFYGLHPGGSSMDRGVTMNVPSY